MRFGLIILILLAAACGNGAPPPPPRAKAVVVAPAIVGPIAHTIRIPGVVRSPRDAMLSSPAFGRVIFVVEEGTRVKQGAVVARLDSKEAEAHARAARARAAQADADLQRARQSLARLQALGDRATVQELEAAATGERLALAARDAAVADAAASRVSEGELTIVAPFSGTIIEKVAEKGETISPGGPVVRLTDLSSLEIAASAGEADALGIKAGELATITVAAREGETHSVSVKRVDRVVTSASRTAEVVFALPPGIQLLPGSLAQAIVVTDFKNGAITVPRESLQQSGSEWFVWIIDGDKAVRRKVTVGIVSEDRAEIIAGISAGESVVIRGASTLIEGDLVKAGSLE